MIFPWLSMMFPCFHGVFMIFQWFHDVFMRFHDIPMTLLGFPWHSRTAWAFTLVAGGAGVSVYAGCCSGLHRATFHDIPMSFHDSHDGFMTFSWNFMTFHDNPMIFMAPPWSFHDFLWYFHVFHGVFIIFPWFSWCFHDISWHSHDFAWLSMTFSARMGVYVGCWRGRRKHLSRFLLKPASRHFPWYYHKFPWFPWWFHDIFMKFHDFSW